MNHTTFILPDNGVLKIAYASVIGNLHLKGKRNNQDSFVFDQNGSFSVLIVADGCTDEGTSHNELGSDLGSLITLETTLQVAPLHCSKPISGDEKSLKKLSQHLTNETKAALSAHLHPISPKNRDGLILSRYLFTIVGIIITPFEVLPFSFGDGLYGLNGKTYSIGPFPENKPPYIGYNLLSKSPTNLDFVLHPAIRLDQLQTLMLGTDGVQDLLDAEDKLLPGKTELVGPFSQFIEDEIYYSNPIAATNRLKLIAHDRFTAGTYVQAGQVKGRLIKHPGLLPDDTTFIVATRTKSGGENED